MIEIAKVLKPHGIRGDLKVHVFSGNVESFCARGFAYVKEDGAFKRVAYTPVRAGAPFAYLQFEGVATRNDAELMRGTMLYLKREEFDKLEKGEHYVHDLIGLRVVDTDGGELGEIAEVLQHGAADVYVVKGARGFMFPALKRVILGIDIRKETMTVDAQMLGEVAVYDD